MPSTQAPAKSVLPRRTGLVYSIVDGMEGDEVKDSNRPDVGKRAINGWKNSGLPRTYALDTKLMAVPCQRSPRRMSRPLWC